MMLFFDGQEEKEFSKRVAFMISSQHFILTGGIGAFARSFVRMCKDNDILVDIILDKDVADENMREFALKNDLNLITPPTALPYSIHTQTFSFTDSLNLEKVLNFKNSLLFALGSNIYDAAVINTPEALFATYPLGLHNRIPVVFYTHHENLVFMNSYDSGVFSKEYNEIAINQMCLPGIIVGTQSKLNVSKIKSAKDIDVRCLPMKIPDVEFLNDYETERSGVIFIGRHEDRKNPSEFVRMASATGLTVKVLTNKRGAEKFKTDFDKADVKDYDIRYNLSGEEKARFVKSAKVAYHPSKLESYGFCAFETLHCCPTVTLKEYGWGDAFDDAIVVSAQDVDDTILRCYNSDCAVDIEKYRNIDVECDRVWCETLFTRPTYNTNDKRTKIFDYCQEKISFSDLLLNLGRKGVSVEDIFSVYNKHHMIDISHSKSNSFLKAK